MVAGHNEWKALITLRRDKERQSEEQLEDRGRTFYCAARPMQNASPLLNLVILLYILSEVLHSRVADGCRHHADVCAFCSPQLG